MCGVDKSKFKAEAKVVAGFAENQGEPPAAPASLALPGALLGKKQTNQNWVRAMGDGFWPGPRPPPAGYGLGTNSMTGEQKSLLIYGSLLFLFFLFLGGYLLQ